MRLHGASFIGVFGVVFFGAAGTAFAQLQATTLRAKLLKIGAVIVRNTRCVRVMLSSAYPYQPIFRHAALALRSP